MGYMRMPGCIRTHWDKLGHTGTNWDILGWDTHKDMMYQVASGHTGRYWDILGHTGMGHMRMICARLHQDILEGTGTYWDVLGWDT